ncbi:MAG: polyprenyl synthetase family protein [Chitinophagales bacterium]|jgi:geranylgeranyl diphosphate synthase type II|nr:polyprenyl synthetase family protein [Chitinophagales bacterium]
MILDKYCSQFNDFLHQNLPNLSPEHLNEPFKYMMYLDAKRIRPSILLACAEMYQIDIDPVLLNLCMSIEIFHNFTLIHDDIMDNSEIRRGEPTAFKKFGLNTSLLSGDAMLILSYKLLEKAKDKPYFYEVFELINNTALKICSGQQLDMDFEQEYNVTEQEYMLMIDYKTGVLIGSSLCIAALLSSQSKKEIQDLYEIGRNIGLSFQIQDDILDCFGNQNKVGKIIGGDIINNKKTILSIYALKNAHKNQIAIMNKWLETKTYIPEKIEDFQNIYMESGALTYAENLRNHYTETSKKLMENLSISSENKEKMLQIMNYLVYREK